MARRDTRPNGETVSGAGAELRAVARALRHGHAALFRNIDGLSALAAERLDDGADPTLRECLSRSGAAARRGKAQAFQLADFLSVIADPAPSAPPARFRDAAETARARCAELLAAAGATVSVSGEATLAIAPERLEGALERLIDNAVRRGGARRVTIATETAPETALGGGGVLIRVLDDGAGPPQCAPERLFTPFERVETGAEALPPGAADDGEAGLGLGLAWCRAAILGVGGAVAFAPVAQGALVEIRLPFAA